MRTERSTSFATASSDIPVPDKYVSIPFDRENPFGLYLHLFSNGHDGEVCFDSLRAGKSFRTRGTNSEVTKDRKFRFPLTGKALSDAYTTKGAGVRYKVFRFPSRGKAFAGDDIMIDMLLYGSVFRFPLIGKALSDSCRSCANQAWRNYVSIPFAREIPFGRFPLFLARSSRGSVHPKPNANCAGQFLGEILVPKSHKPPCTLTQTRFFGKNGSEVQCHQGAWAISAAFGRD